MAVSGMPFLYMTRTILRGAPRARPAAALRTLTTTTSRLKSGSEIPFEHEVAQEEVPFEQSAPPPRGTITPSERQVFERIFADIRARGLQPTVRDEAEAKEPPTTAQRSAMLIMQQAAYDVGQSRSSTVASPALLAGAARDRSKALLKFPPELRAAASKALNAFDPHEPARGVEADGVTGATAAEAEEDAGWKSPAHSFMRTVEVEAKRLPERQRVERAITAAKSDHELWAVLEEEVFTFPFRFGLAASPPPVASAPTKVKKSRRKIEAERMEKAAADAAAAEARAAREADLATILIDDVNLDNDDKTTATSSDPSIPYERMSLYIYGPLYPAYLLLALRRLDSAFTLPSPLVFNLLPRIKELGLESYVLGISTPFYNELLDIHWRRRGDLSGMLALLEEMRHCGLYFDEQTSSILAAVSREARDLSRGGRPVPSETSPSSSLPSAARGSGFAAAVMNMPEYETSVRDRIRHWQRAVDISINERKGDFGNSPVA